VRIAYKILVQNREEILEILRRILLKWVLKDGEGLDWIHLAHNMDQWRDVLKTVMNLRVP
jgi:hypothetical protein